MGNDLQVFRYPQDKAAVEKNLWTIQQAAKAWGVHYTTAKRLIERHAEEVDACRVVICRPHGRSEKTMIRAGAPRPSSPPPGNPQFHDRELQRARAMERWDKEMTEADQIVEYTNEVYKLNTSASRLANMRERGRLPFVNYAALLQKIAEASKRIGQESVQTEIAEIEKALGDQ